MLAGCILKTHISSFAWVSHPVQTTVFAKVSGVGLVIGMLTVKFVLLIPHCF